jgi:hypothetical protein
MNTMQEEFDAVVEHLFKQGRRSMNGRHCAYRGEEGTSCAVGCRIPDDYYDSVIDHGTSMTTTGLSTVLQRYPEHFPPEVHAYHEMFRKLQDVHDMAITHSGGLFSKTSLRDDLVTVAREFHLTYNHKD